MSTSVAYGHTFLATDPLPQPLVMYSACFQEAGGSSQSGVCTSNSGMFLCARVYFWGTYERAVVPKVSVPLLWPSQVSDSWDGRIDSQLPSPSVQCAQPPQRKAGDGSQEAWRG